jgi:16S rRNA (guanine527-N7)-methyltransferase
VSSVREKLKRRAAKAGVSLPAEVLCELEAYFELLRKWNRKVSLTSLPVETAGDEAIDRLLIEPVLAARYLPRADAHVIDIGSGGGSPAIPLRVAAPETSMRLVESKTRKAAFLREVVRSLHLDRTEVDAVRFEELLVRPDLHETADAVTMRAVKVDSKVLATLQTFLKPGGVILLFGTRPAFASKQATPVLTSHASHKLLAQWGSQLEVMRKIAT